MALKPAPLAEYAAQLEPKLSEALDCAYVDALEPLAEETSVTPDVPIVCFRSDPSVFRRAAEVTP